VNSLRQTVSTFFADILNVGADTTLFDFAGLWWPSDEALQSAAERHKQHLANMTAQHNDWLNINAELEKAAAEQRAANEQLIADAIVDIRTNMYSAMSSLGKEYFELMKNVQTVDTIISTYASAQKAFQSLVGIPVVGPALATAAAAAAIVAGMARVAQIRAQEYPSAHGGMTRVPREQTYLLNAGERVLSPNQNADLKAFMEQNTQPQVTGSTFMIDFPNTDLASMSRSDAEDFAENVMAPALKKLAVQGLY
jgi:hypothetical protein